MAKVLRFDSGILQKPRKTPQGFLRVDGYASRVGVLTYRDPRFPTGVRRELRLPDDVFNPSSLTGFEGAPITEDHPSDMVVPHTVAAVQKGTVLSAGRQDDDHVAVSFVVTDPGLIKKMESGEKRALSVGYKVDLDETPGEHPKYGRYDAIQRNIEPNHLAVLAVGRAGPTAVARMDAAYEVDDENSPGTPAPPDGDGDGDDVQLETADDVRVAMTRFGQETYKDSAAKRRAYDLIVAAAQKQGLNSDLFEKRWCERLDAAEFFNAVRQDDVLTAEQRDKLKAKSFAAPDGGLPVEDEAHTRAAMARFGQEKFPDSAAKAAAFHKIIARAKHFGIDPSGFEAKWKDRLDDLRVDEEDRDATGKWTSGGASSMSAKAGEASSSANKSGAAEDHAKAAAAHTAASEAHESAGSSRDAKFHATVASAHDALAKDTGRRQNQGETRDQPYHGPSEDYPRPATGAGPKSPEARAAQAQVENHAANGGKRTNESGPKTFAQAKAAHLSNLSQKGWDVKPGLKTPHATSPDGSTRLWFKPQAVHVTKTSGDQRHELGNARSLGVDHKSASTDELARIAMARKDADMTLASEADRCDQCETTPSGPCIIHATCLSAIPVPDYSDKDEPTVNLEQALAALAASNEKLGAATARADAAEQKLTAAEAAKVAAEAMALDASKNLEQANAATAKARQDAADAMPAKVAARVTLLAHANTVLGATDKDGKVIDRTAQADRDLKIAIIRRQDGDDTVKDDAPEVALDILLSGAVKRHAAAAQSLAGTRQSIETMRTDGAAAVQAGDSEKKAAQDLRSQYGSAWTKPTTITKKDE